jgi:hypothetical protein
MTLPKLVRCLEHRESCCWIQLSGKHISCRACECSEKEGYQCPIDGHAMRWTNTHPQWSPEAQHG